MRRTPIRTSATFVAAAAMALALAACSGDDPPTDDTPADDTAAEAPADAADGEDTAAEGDEVSDGDATVVASFFTFEPEELSVATGTTVTFVNEDSVRHTFTSGEGEADGTFDLETVAEGDTAEFTFDEAGTYPYFCEVHASMTGTITVE
jgi:plastocyanin